MRLAAYLIGAVAALSVVTPALVTPAAGAIRISGDPGGQIGTYVAKYMQIRQSGENVIIDGPCISACTIILGLVPANRVCVTPRAVFGFHAAWRHDGSGNIVTSNGGTRLLWDIYPARVRTLLTRKGGLSRKMVMVRGRELASLYSPCRSDFEVAKRGNPRAPSVVNVPPSTDSAREYR